MTDEEAVALAKSATTWREAWDLIGWAKSHGFTFSLANWDGAGGRPLDEAWGAGFARDRKGLTDLCVQEDAPTAEMAVCRAALALAKRLKATAERNSLLPPPPEAR